MVNCEKFYNALRKNGLDFFTGVPDSLLKSFCAYIEDNTETKKNIIAANEGNAIALATGHYLATDKPGLVYMQNAGLGNAVNPLTSLTDKSVYSIPLLLLIGWRAEPGVKDEPQHIKMGEITLEILNTLGIPYKILDDKFEETIREAKRYMEQKKSPYAIVVRKDIFEKYDLKNKKISDYELSREEALKAIAPMLGDNDIVVSTTGMVSRELFELRELIKQGHARDFLTVGSMGHSSSIALGIAIEKPNRRVYCFDGDGALIMHMGSLPVIGQLGPSNFKHIVFNNFAHDSVGGQQTAANNIDFIKVAKGSGYKEAFSTRTKKELLSYMNKIKNIAGPVLLEIQVNKGSRKDLGRPTNMPQENKDLFMNFVAEDSYEHSFNKLKSFLVKKKVRNIFLVTGKASFSLSGTEAALKKALSSYRVTRFSDFHVNPNMEGLIRGIKLFKNKKYDAVIAIGGGSVIDMAKLINILSAQDGNPYEYIKKEKEIKKKGRPLVAIPTTVGSGSEATHFAVLYIDKLKYSVAHKYLLPDYSIVDAVFTRNLPGHIIASSGADALCQAIESYWSVNSTEASKEYSRRAIELAISNLENAVKDSSPESRQAMLEAAHLAGRAINITKTTAPHAISYPITAYFGVAHGHAVSLTLGKILKYNSEVKKNDAVDSRGHDYIKRTIKEICLFLSVDSVVSAGKKLEGLMKTIGLATRFRDLGLKKKDLDLVLENVNLERLGNNPREITARDLRLILESIY